MLRIITIAIIIGTASQANAEGTIEKLDPLSDAQVRNILLSGGCTELGNVRLHVTHRGPWKDGMTREFEHARDALFIFLRELEVELEDILVIRFDGKYLYKSEAPPEVWEHFMEKTQFTIDPKHFALVYEAVCAPSWDRDEEFYDPEIVKEAIVMAREALRSQGH